MKERFLKMFRRSRDLNAIAEMSEADLADMGVSRAQAQALAAVEDSVPVRLAEMARSQHVPETVLARDRDSWHELVHRCAECHDVPACERYLAREEGMDAESVAFCPNMAMFNALAAR
ncbi:DUF6455 family protein [Pararhodobacter zhoushanensis]|uniref:DUF6455 family protein n=1 Tax=Pararhodobacter zhoushanensis TaxID=2479545 RepID=A0ABT3GW85_9RHOB|nr:DUF6455 family protein [Pararhodobacter zhoushanensis]MCW1931790.1 DUF6455 family protein [Pararhodobacter zhoushanensis]